MKDDTLQFTLSAVFPAPSPTRDAVLLNAGDANVGW